MNKRLRVELLLHLGVTPVEWDAAAHHRIHDFFSLVTRGSLILISHAEKMPALVFQLRAISLRQQEAHIIHERARAIHLADSIEVAHKIVALAAHTIAADERAEIALFSHQLFRSNHRRLAGQAGSGTRSEQQHTLPVWETVAAFILNEVMRERIIRIIEVRMVVFTGKENLNPGERLVAVTEVTVDEVISLQVILCRHQLHGKMGSQPLRHT